VSGDFCPTCDCAGDGWLGDCTPVAIGGRYSTGSRKFTPACSRHGTEIDAIGTSGSEEGAVYLASRADHSWGKPWYCADSWHDGKTGDALGND
jgi:hypothetical protein